MCAKLFLLDESHEEKLDKFSLSLRRTNVEGIGLSCPSGLLCGELVYEGGFHGEWDLICCQSVENPPSIWLCLVLKSLKAQSTVRLIFSFEIFCDTHQVIIEQH